MPAVSPARRPSPRRHHRRAGLRHNRAAGRLPVNRSHRRARTRRPRRPCSAPPWRSPSRAACPARSGRRPRPPRPRRRPDDAATADADPRATDAHPGADVQAVQGLARRHADPDRAPVPHLDPQPVATGTARRTHRSTRRARTTGPTASSSAGCSGCCRARSTSRRRTTARAGSRHAHARRHGPRGPRRARRRPRAAPRSRGARRRPRYPRHVARRGPAPRIVVTLQVPAAQSEPDIAAARTRCTWRRCSRHGAATVPLDATASGPSASRRSRRWTGCCSAAARTSTRPATGRRSTGRAGWSASATRSRRQRGRRPRRGACRCSGSAAGSRR